MNKKMIAMLVAGLAVIFCVKAASAATFEVSVTDDRTNPVPPACTSSDPCSLREAVKKSNEDATADTIRWTPLSRQLFV